MNGSVALTDSGVNNDLAKFHSQMSLHYFLCKNKREVSLGKYGCWLHCVGELSLKSSWTVFRH